jgi:hypothetical protein
VGIGSIPSLRRLSLTPWSSRKCYLIVNIHILIIMLPFLVDSGKAFGAFDGLDQPISQLLIIFVWRQVQPVETGMGPRKAVGVAPLLNCEGLGPIAPVQLLESIHRDA